LIAFYIVASLIA